MSITDLQHAEGWNISDPSSLSIQYAEGWNTELLILDQFTLSADPLKGAAPLSPTLSGSAHRNDGNAPREIELAIMDPTGTTATETVPVSDGSFSTSLTLETPGDWDVQGRSRFAQLQHTDGWNIGPFTGSLAHSEGWNS